MESTWYGRDLPVLETAILFFEENGPDAMPTAQEIAEAEGRPSLEVLLALHALNGEYLELDEMMGNPDETSVRRILPAARRAAGQWPTAEQLAAQFLAGLEQAAEQEQDPETRSKLKAAAKVLASAGRDLTINLLASLIAKGAGLG